MLRFRAKTMYFFILKIDKYENEKKKSEKKCYFRALKML